MSPPEVRQSLAHAEALDVESGSDAELLHMADGNQFVEVKSLHRLMRCSRLRATGLGAAFLASVLMASFSFRTGNARQPHDPANVERSVALNAELGRQQVPTSSGSSDTNNSYVQKPTILRLEDTVVHKDTGNCEFDEELLGVLCYKKCSLLTNSAYSIRTSAMTCCSAHPCNFFNMDHNVGICGGFSIGGGDRPSCPHPPGGCAPNEELHLGQCYKKCSILTENFFVHRVGPATCCKHTSKFLCFMPIEDNSRTRWEFVTSGTGGKPHFPKKSFLLNATLTSTYTTTTTTQTTLTETTSTATQTGTTTTMTTTATQTETTTNTTTTTAPTVTETKTGTITTATTTPTPTSSTSTSTSSSSSISRTSSRTSSSSSSSSSGRSMKSSAVTTTSIDTTTEAVATSAAAAATTLASVVPPGSNTSTGTRPPAALAASAATATGTTGRATATGTTGSATLPTTKHSAPSSLAPERAEDLLVKATSSPVETTTTSSPVETTTALGSTSNIPQVPSWAEEILEDHANDKTTAPGNATAPDSTSMAPQLTIPETMKNGTKVPKWLKEMVKEEEAEELTEEKAQREQIGADDLLAPPGSTTPKSLPLPAWAKEYLNGAQATAGG